MIHEIISEEEYAGILEKMPICCVDIVIHRHNKVILILRKNEPFKGFYWVPGGRVIKKERLEEAALRKASEETGLEVELIRKIGVYETISEKSPFKSMTTGVHSVNIVFLAKAIEGSEEKIDKNHKSFMWVESITEEMHPYIKQILHDSGILNNTGNSRNF